MAGNLLPIVLIGGVAFALTSKKKKRKKSPCPSMVSIEISEIPQYGFNANDGKGGEIVISVPKEMFEDYSAGNRDVIGMAKRVLSRFLPESCMGMGSVKIKASGSGGEVTLRAPEAVVLMAAEFLEDMSIGGKVDEDAANAMWDDAVQWWSAHMGDEPIPN